MEQKQLDELDESCFEEFVDEDPLEDVKISSAKTKKSKTIAKKSSKKEDSSDKIEIIPVKEAEPVKGFEKEKVHVEDKKVFETSSPVDPWESEKVQDPWNDDDEDDGEGFFKEVSTWKAITGIIVVLLIFSVFTQGFQFTEGASPTGAFITSVQAQDTVLAYVNNNLLQPPFVAEAVSSEDVGSLYKVSLSVAGQNVDSYITKDGALFFPQGFDTTVDPLTGESVNVDGSVTEQPVEVVTEEPVVAEKEVATEPVVEQPKEVVKEVVVEEPQVEEKPVETPATQLSVGYKKWSFSPNKVQVKKGEKVQLTLSADDSNPSFTLSGLTFAIPDLGVEQVVVGTSVIEFTADKTGSFAFTCTSCTGTQAVVMQGMLVVE